MSASNTAAHTPPARPSDEADRTQLQMAREEGAKYLASLEYMANEVADNGGKQHAGDFIVAFAQERAEGMYEMNDGELAWMEAGEDKNCHMEIAVLDATDHRFVPYLDITCSLSRDGKEVRASSRSSSGIPASTTTARTSRCRATASTT